MIDQRYTDLINSLMTQKSKLEKQVLELTMENAELKDKLNNIGEHPETDGLEVGIPSDYEDNNQLNLFDDKNS
tara:strand:- start:730 stop:948 length:219 start_codon:yes stop_codon:yes gene_type:complete